MKNTINTHLKHKTKITEDELAIVLVERILKTNKTVKN